MSLDEDVHYGTRVRIRRVAGFADLYADTGVPVPEAPRTTEKKKFRTAVVEMDDWTLRAVREYDRNRSGGIVNGE